MLEFFPSYLLPPLLTHGEAEEGEPVKPSQRTLQEEESPPLPKSRKKPLLAIIKFSHGITQAPPQSITESTYSTSFVAARHDTRLGLHNTGDDTDSTDTSIKRRNTYSGHKAARMAPGVYGLHSSKRVKIGNNEDEENSFGGSMPHSNRRGEEEGDNKDEEASLLGQDRSRTVSRGYRSAMSHLGRQSAYTEETVKRTTKDAGNDEGNNSGDSGHAPKGATHNN
ncbi:hypothetical protein K469DRAFT_808585 [Zopfia rhizophila CBS 207.26]|uniref:Uncharacterized protein n=1 Tax=Zopfia rhizophila CBS 207.26 TaxID=1314779 RepID=A0A6A6EKB7_9PEZI|nr:hypothetical protein K469DRAFT_808585 [Zopfia rhizophila CBS 207.26]